MAERLQLVRNVLKYVKSTVIAKNVSLTIVTFSTTIVFILTITYLEPFVHLRI